MLINILYLLLGCIFLAWGADRFVVGASAIARNFTISPLIIGIILVGFSTSFPEMLVSLMAAVQGKSALSLGNALGSYITNIGLVLGVTALVVPLKVHSRLIKREFPMLVGALLFVWLLLSDGSLGRLDGWLMLTGFLTLIVLMSYFALRNRNVSDPLVKEFEQSTMASQTTTPKALFFLVLGFIVLYFSSQLLIYSASAIARYLGVSDLVIGLTIVAVGTSLPELGASVMSAIKNEPDIALGNVIGSNMFGILAVTAMPGIFSPGAINKVVLWREFPLMFAITALLFFICRRLKSGAQITRSKGGILLLSFLFYFSWVYLKPIA